MQNFEYRVLPAPRRGIKLKGARTPEERFARGVEGEMNRMARDGWEYVRSDTLPSEQRQGLFGGTATVFQTLLVFRRPVARGAEAGVPVVPPTMIAPPTAAPALAGPIAATEAPARPSGLPRFMAQRDEPVPDAVPILEEPRRAAE